MLEDRAEPSVLVELLELVDLLLEAFGDRQVAGMDQFPPVRLGIALGDDQLVVDLLVDEVAVPLEVGPVDVEPGCSAKEALELRDSTHRHGDPSLAREQAAAPAS